MVFYYSSSNPKIFGNACSYSLSSRVYVEKSANECVGPCFFVINVCGGLNKKVPISSYMGCMVPNGGLFRKN